MVPARWSQSDAPSLRRRVAVVTGANSGIGLETARYLAQLGAQVVMACRNVTAAQAARAALTSSVPGAQVVIEHLDLSDLASVVACAERLRRDHEHIDILVNNAGVMRQRRELTTDGFEMDFGTNFLGHFALTGLLLPTLRAAPAGRVVTVGSQADHAGVIDFDDLSMARGFSPARAYARAKLAQLIVAMELGRRADRRGLRLISVAAHPGASQSAVLRDQAVWLRWLFTAPSLRRVRRTVVSEANAGALMPLRAATDPTAKNGQYFGPAGWLGLTGPPVLRPVPRRATDPVIGEKLWRTAERLTGVHIDV